MQILTTEQDDHIPSPRSISPGSDPNRFKHAAQKRQLLPTAERPMRHPNTAHQLSERRTASNGVSHYGRRSDLAQMF